VQTLMTCLLLRKQIRKHWLVPFITPWHVIELTWIGALLHHGGLAVLLRRVLLDLVLNPILLEIRIVEVLFECSSKGQWGLLKDWVSLSHSPSHSVMVD
jgi:hypothetical protein